MADANSRSPAGRGTRRACVRSPKRSTGIISRAAPASRRTCCSPACWRRTKCSELAQLRERLDEVERERDLLETALSSATDARGRLERDLRAAREEADSRSNAEASAQAERIATLEKRCADLQHRLEDAQMQELPLTGGSFRSAGEELLPALERFAGLLESCADKLEGGPANA